MSKPFNDLKETNTKLMTEKNKLEMEIKNIKHQMAK